MIAIWEPIQHGPTSSNNAAAVFAQGNVLPFSPRPNTPASRMPQVEREQVKARAARLRDAAAARRTRWLDSLAGTAHTVLIEGAGTGHTDSFAPVAVSGAGKGEVLAVRIVSRDGDHLVGVAE